MELYQTMEVLSLVVICYNLLCEAFVSEEYKSNGMIKHTQTLEKCGNIFHEIFRRIAEKDIGLLHSVMNNIDANVLSIAYSYGKIELARILGLKNSGLRLWMQEGVYRSQISEPHLEQKQKPKKVPKKELERQAILDAERQEFIARDTKLRNRLDATSYLMYNQGYIYNGYILAYCSMDDNKRLIDFVNKNVCQYDILVYYDDLFDNGYKISRGTAEKFNAYEKISSYLDKNPIKLIDPDEILKIKIDKPVVQQKNVVYCEVDEAQAEKIEKIRQLEKDKQMRLKKQKAIELKKQSQKQSQKTGPKSTKSRNI